MKMILLILASANLLLAQQKVIYNIDSQSSYTLQSEDNMKFQYFNNTRYVEFNNDFGYNLLVENIYIKNQLIADGSYGEINSKAYLMKDRVPTNIIWEITEFAHDAQLGYPFYITIQDACCGDESTKSYFNLNNGKKIFSTTSGILNIFTENRDKLYISFLSISASKDFPSQYPYDSNVKGILSLSTKDNVISRLIILYKGEIADYDYTPDLYFNNTRKTNEINIPILYNDKKDLNSIELSIQYYTDNKIYIIIQNGNFTVTNNADFEEFEFSLISEDEKDNYLFNENFLNIDIKSKSELRLLRNEIFARNGHSFDGEDLKTNFKSKSWYKEKVGYTVRQDDLTNNELTVLKRIQNLENRVQ